MQALKPGADGDQTHLGQGHGPWAALSFPGVSQPFGAKTPSRAVKSRSQVAPQVMEQVRLHLPLHHQKSPSIRRVGGVGEEAGHKQVRQYAALLVRQAALGCVSGGKGKRKGTNRSFSANRGGPIASYHHCY